MNDLTYEGLLAVIERVPDQELREALKVVARAAVARGDGLEDRNDTTWGVWEADGEEDNKGIFIGLYRF